MVMTTSPGHKPLLRLESGPNESTSMYPVILATVVLCSTLTTIFTAARLITKRFISAYNLEDYMLMLAWVASIAFDFVLLAAGLAGLGYHVSYLRESQLVKLDQYGWALELLYSPVTWLAKASLLFQLIRIFTPMKSGPVYLACHTLIWGNLAFYISIFFSIIFECHPIWEVWSPSLGLDTSRYCINRNMLLVVSSAVNVFSDLLNLLLPNWATWHLQMAPKRKAGIIAIFTTGLLAFISSISKLIYSIHALFSLDPSYINAQNALWGLAEIATIILCACFPMMPRFVRLVSEHYTNSKHSSPSPKTDIRRLKIVKVNDVQSSTEISRGSQEEQFMAWVKSPYQQLGDEGNEGSERKAIVRDLGMKREVDIEMASWDQLNARSRVASTG